MKSRFYSLEIPLRRDRSETGMLVDRTLAVPPLEGLDRWVRRLYLSEQLPICAMSEMLQTLSITPLPRRLRRSWPRRLTAVALKRWAASLDSGSAEVVGAGCRDLSGEALPEVQCPGSRPMDLRIRGPTRRSAPERGIDRTVLLAVGEGRMFPRQRGANNYQ